MTSYQKLKQENTRLKAELHTLSVYPDSERAVLIRALYKLQHDTEQAILAGKLPADHPTLDDKPVE